MEGGGWRVEGGGRRVEGSECRISGVEHLTIDNAIQPGNPKAFKSEARTRGSGSVFWISGSGFRAGSGFRVPGFGFRVLGSGIRVPGSGFRVSGFGFRVSGLTRNRCCSCLMDEVGSVLPSNGQFSNSGYFYHTNVW